MNERSRQRLRDALRAARLIDEHVRPVTLEDSLADEWFRSAVDWQLVVVGEALNDVRRAQPDFEDHFPKIHEWVAQRNVLIHLYDQIDDTMVWRVVRDELPSLIVALDQALSPDIPSSEDQE